MRADFLAGFAVSFGLVFFLTFIARRLAERLRVFDFPDKARKIQKGPVPKLGGLAIYLSFALTILGWLIFSPGSFGPYIKLSYLVGLLLGGAVLVIGGYLDDRFSLKPAQQVLFPISAVLIIIFSGVQLSYINHPLGGSILLDQIKLSGYPLFGGVFVFVWTLGMIYTTKFLDGMDGLVSGITGIGAVVLFFLSQIPVVDQKDTALLSIIFAGATLGFLPWNFHPAKIFLGEGGSTLTGFVLGTLAVIAGGKIATALLIMGVPILDAAWVILRRIASQFSPFQGDRKHLHFRLLDVGMNQRQAVLLLYFLSAAFGVSGLFLQSVGKLVALFILLGVMVVLGTTLVVVYSRKNK